MSLRRFLAIHWIITDAEARAHIGEGLVRVNGERQTDVDYELQPGDRVQLGALTITA